jgi:hypothetical protein
MEFMFDIPFEYKSDTACGYGIIVRKGKKNYEIRVAGHVDSVWVTNIVAIDDMSDQEIEMALEGQINIVRYLQADYELAEALLAGLPLQRAGLD